MHKMGIEGANPCTTALRDVVSAHETLFNNQWSGTLPALLGSGTRRTRIDLNSEVNLLH